MRLFFSGGDATPNGGTRQTLSVLAGRFRQRLRAWGWLLGCGILGVIPGWAQDAFRASLAGQAAAEARKQALQNQRFNVKLGPVALRLSEQLGFEATDNVRNTSAENAESDFIIRPRQNILASWRVTERNSFDLALGVGYEKYVRTSQYDNVFITPDSDLSFDLYAGDFLINLHSRFSYSQDVVSDPSISGVGTLSRFENTSGIRATWDLNQLVLTFEYDHEIYKPTETQYSQYARASELGTISAGYRIHPSAFAGLAVGGGLTNYDEDEQPDNSYYSVGPFFRVEPSQYTNIRIAGGYVSYFIDTSPTTQVNAFYFDLTLQQKVTTILSHTLSAGRQLQTGVFAETTDQYYVRYSANWAVFRKIGMTTSLSYQHISDENYSDSTSDSDEIADFYSVGLTFSRPLTRHMTGSIGYQFYLKNSDVADYDYQRNQLALNLIYAF